MRKDGVIHGNYKIQTLWHPGQFGELIYPSFHIWDDIQSVHECKPHMNASLT